MPPAVRQQMEAIQQRLQQAEAALQEAQAQIGLKREELASKERIELRKIEADLVLEDWKLGQAASMAAFRAEIDAMQARLDPVGEQPMGGQVGNEGGRPPEMGGPSPMEE